MSDILARGIASLAALDATGHENVWHRFVPEESDKAYGLIFWDDIHISQLDALKVHKSRNVPAMLNVITGIVGNADRLTWNDIAKFADAGWEIASHAHTFPDFATMTEQQIDYEIGTSVRVLRQHGYRVIGISTPAGSGKDNETFVRVATRYGLRWASVYECLIREAPFYVPLQSARVAGYYPPFNWLQIPFIAYNPLTANNIKTRVLPRVARLKGVVGLYMHTVLPSGDDVSTATLADLLDYGISLGINWVTVSELMTKRRATTLDLLASNELQESAVSSDAGMYVGYPYGWTPSNTTYITMGTDEVSGRKMLMLSPPDSNPIWIESKYTFLRFPDDGAYGQRYTLSIEYKTSVPKPVCAIKIREYGATNNFLREAVVFYPLETADWTSADIVYTVSDDARIAEVVVSANNTGTLYLRKLKITPRYTA